MVRAHVTRNQFNAYLEHATNTEHANLIILHPQQTSTFGGQGLATEKQVKHGARARYRKPIQRLPRARQPYDTPPNKRTPSVDRVSHGEECKTWCARMLQKTNSTITYSTLQTPSTPALFYSSPQQTQTFGRQGLAKEKQVKMVRARYKTPLQRLPRARYKHRARQPYFTPPPNKRTPSMDRG